MAQGMNKAMDNGYGDALLLSASIMVDDGSILYICINPKTTPRRFASLTLNSLSLAPQSTFYSNVQYRMLILGESDHASNLQFSAVVCQDPR